MPSSDVGIAEGARRSLSPAVPPHHMLRGDTPMAEWATIPPGNADWVVIAREAPEFLGEDALP